MSKEKTITQLEKEKKEIEAQIELLKKEVKLAEFIIIDGWAYETKEHDFNKPLSDIKIPEGKELWLPSECWKFYENKELREKLNLVDCWFFVQQVRENTSDVAGFFADSYRANLNCNRDPSFRYASLGVRFKWKVDNKKMKGGK